MAQTAAFYVSNRLQAVTMAFFCLMAAQLMAASCTPEPAPYAARVEIIR